MSHPPRNTKDLARPLAEAIQSARSSEARLQGIFESAMDAIISVDTTLRISLFNAAAERMFGYAAAEVLGTSLERLLPERFRAGHGEHIRKFGQTRVSSRAMGHERIVAALRKSGEEFPIDASISQVEVGGEHFYTVILRDVSVRVQAERDLAAAREELRRLAVASRTAREQENRRISRELHDELGQDLTSLKMDLAWLSSQLGDASPEVLATVESMRRLLDATMAAARRISADLRPLMLDDLGLAAALEWLATEASRRNPLQVTLDIDPHCERLVEPLASQVFRIVQEGLTNVSRHAEASGVRVELRARDGVVRLVIEDDGRGMDADDQKKEGSFGLVGIRERVYMLEGKVEISSAPGKGTRIVAELPHHATGSAP